MSFFKPAEQDPSFEMWWREYPRKVCKGDARRAWLQVTNMRPDLPTMLRALAVVKCSEQWRADGGKFIPHASTYLRREQWDDVEEIDYGDIVKGQPWYETVTGVEKKAAELGLVWDKFNGETYLQFTSRVKHEDQKLKLVRAA